MEAVPHVMILAAIASAVGAAMAAEVPGNAVEGRALAIKVCGYCHVVASDQEWTPLLRIPTPSFQTIANRKGATAASLQKFILTTHSNPEELKSMPNPMLTDDQAADVASYILSLKKPEPKP